jgi:hypothetical protein
VIATRISGIRAATPLTLDVAVLTAYQLQAMAQVNQLRTTLQAIDQFDDAIAKLAPTLPDYVLLVSTLNSRGKPTSNQHGLRFLSN